MRTLVPLLIILTAPALQAQAPVDSAAAADGSDAVVATVDGEPIPASAIDRLIDLDMAPVAGDEAEIDPRREVLNLLIGDRLRDHELRELGLDAPEGTDAAGYLATLRRELPGLEPILRQLGSSDIPAEDLARVLGRQVMALTYVEERLGADIFVRADEIETHYRQRIVPVYDRRGETPPGLDELRPYIRATLREGRLRDELERWTAELRREAEVEVFLGAPVEGGEADG